MITRQALGRIHQLGELYDAYTDNFCGIGIFNDKLPETEKDIIDNEDKFVKYIYNDTMEEKLDKFDIGGELMASLLSGTAINIGGSGKYLNSKSKSARESSAALVCKRITKNESVNISHGNVISLLSPDSVTNMPNATHFVSGIQWGAIAIATVKCTKEESDDEKEIKAELKAKIAQLDVGGSGHAENKKDVHDKSSNFQFELHADALPGGGDIPQEFEQAREFMRKLPTYVANANGGKGVPICYTLMPLSAIKTHLGNIESDRIVNSINEYAINEAVRTFDEMNESMRELNDIHDNFQKHSYCIMDDVMGSVSNRKLIVQRAQDDIKTKLHKAIVSIRHGTLSSSEEIDNIIKSYENSPASRPKVRDFINSLRSSRDKITFATSVKEQGVHYVGKEMSLNNLRMKNETKECYVFFCSWKDPNLEMNKELFNGLIKQNTKSCILVDVDIQPEIVQSAGVTDGNRIYHYANLSYTAINYTEKIKKRQKKCLFKCSIDRSRSTTKPNDRVDAIFVCPLSIQGNYCEQQEEHEWFCIVCKRILQYDFVGNFLCDCGSAPISTFQFRCSDPKHGTNFIGFSDNKYLTDLVSRLRPYKEINILILGETGVGKSTWINGFANYLTFRTLKEAEKGKQVYLVPSQFTITDSNGTMKTIQVGESKNEPSEVGASSTQEPRSYVFNDGKRKIRLIDAPGIGDCRGADQDKKNFSSILRYITHVPEIHGICILMKSNNSRMNIVFKYCINELLTHLHVSAADNIAFCFTNARGTFYRPGDTLPVLTKYLGDLKTNRGIDIVTNRETIYCMDNESFRFLCCLHTGEQFTDREHQNFEESWTHSVEETKRLLEHFENDVDPHSVGQTVSLNEARTLILTLAKPLADVTQNIQDNIVVINAEEEKIKELDLKSDGLQKNLMIPKIDFEIKQLDHPRTVCTGINCIETQMLLNSNIPTTIYKTICHDHCRLENVIPETVPNPGLQKCDAMDPSTLKCKNCDCSWEMHMHIMFEQEEVEGMVEDPVVKQKLQKCKDSRERRKIAIERLNELVKKYKEEQKTINEICAKFGAFLKEHAILAYNDAIEDYLKFDIGEAKRQGNNKKSSEILQKVERLEKQLDEYRETKRVLDQEMKSSTVNKVKVENIKKMQEQLEQLELTGKEIKKLFDATVYGRQANFCYNEIHFDDSEYRRRRYRSYFSRFKNWLLSSNR